MTEEIKQFRLSTFQAHVGTDFVIQLMDEQKNMISFVLKLLEVIRLGEKERDIAEYGRESFSLIFENDRKDIYLKQGTYTVEHAVLGTMMLFLVPLGPGKNGMQYEVIVA